MHVGNERSKGELTSVLKIHEEIISVDCGLSKKVRRNEANIRHWKEGWIEEIDEKLGTRETEIRGNADK